MRRTLSTVAFGGLLSCTGPVRMNRPRCPRRASPTVRIFRRPRPCRSVVASRGSRLRPGRGGAAARFAPHAVRAPLRRPPVGRCTRRVRGRVAAVPLQPISGGGRLGGNGRRGRAAARAAGGLAPRPGPPPFLDPGAQTEVHVHTGTEAWFVVLSGNQCLDSPDGILRMAAGETGVAPAFTPGRSTITGKELRRAFAVVGHGAGEHLTGPATWEPGTTARMSRPRPYQSGVEPPTMVEARR